MQSNTGRALIALAAVVLVVAAFFVIGGDDEAGQGSADPTTPTTAETTETTTGEAPAEEKPAEEKEPADLPTIKLVDGAPIDGVTELEFDVGEQVEFAFTSDIDTELHVHGYDLYPTVRGGETEKVSFPADIDGIYEIENHANALQVAELRVNP